MDDVTDSPLSSTSAASRHEGILFGQFFPAWNLFVKLQLQPAEATTTQDPGIRCHGFTAKTYLGWRRYRHCSHTAVSRALNGRFSMMSTAVAGLLAFPTRAAAAVIQGYSCAAARCRSCVMFGVFCHRADTLRMNEYFAKRLRRKCEEHARKLHLIPELAPIQALQQQQARQSKQSDTSKPRASIDLSTPSPTASSQLPAHADYRIPLSQTCRTV